MKKDEKTYKHNFKTSAINDKENILLLKTTCNEILSCDHTSMFEKHISHFSKIFIGSKQCQECVFFNSINYEKKFVMCKANFKSIQNKAKREANNGSNTIND